MLLTAVTVVSATTANPQSAGQGKGNLIWQDDFAAKAAAGTPPTDRGTGGVVTADGRALERANVITRYVTEGGRSFLQSIAMANPLMLSGSGKQIQFMDEAAEALTYRGKFFIEFDIYANRVGGAPQLMIGGTKTNATFMRLHYREHWQTGVAMWHYSLNPVGGGTGENWHEVMGPGTAVPHVANKWYTFSLWVDTVTGANELYIDGNLVGVNIHDMYAPGDGSATNHMIGTFWFEVRNDPGNEMRISNVRVYEAVAGGVAPGPAPVVTTPTTPTVPTTPVSQTGDTLTFALALVFGGLAAAAFVVRKRVLGR
jgi:hypothetical protein